MRTRHARRWALLSGAVLATAGAIVGVACVIADPPAGIPTPNLLRPYILQEQVVPQLVILTSWPPQFIVPVEVPDPTATVEWEAVLDYNVPGVSTILSSGALLPSDGDDAGVRSIVQNLNQGSIDPTLCHTITVAVALHLLSNGNQGDSVTWFYTPSGNIFGCPLYDAGPVDGAADGALDASLFIGPLQPEGGED